MEHPSPLHLNWQTGAPSVSTLVPRDDLRVDPDALARLHAALGPGVATGILAIARDELAHHLAAVAGAYADCTFEALARSARRIGRIATDIGLPELRRVADNVLDSLAQEEPTALAATVARLERTGRTAVTQVSLMRLPKG